MKLQGMSNISTLTFDIPNRTLEVVHSDSHDNIFTALESLKLNTKHVRTELTDAVSEKHGAERQLLYQVLAINFFFFLLEVTTGFISHSMGLVADSLDMLADAIVYGLSLYAIGHSVEKKKSIAKISGYFQITLAILGFTEVLRRYFGFGEIPSFQMMIGISFFALIGNAASLYLLQKSKSKEAHMQASMIFTSNDVIVNIGVIVAGVFVYLTTSNLPDLVVGTAVFILVARGAYRILQLSK